MLKFYLYVKEYIFAYVFKRYKDILLICLKLFKWLHCSHFSIYSSPIGHVQIVVYMQSSSKDLNYFCNKTNSLLRWTYTIKLNRHFPIPLIFLYLNGNHFFDFHHWRLSNYVSILYVMMMYVLYCTSPPYQNCKCCSDFFRSSVH